MVLRRTVQDREWDKFVEDDAGDTAIRIKGKTDVKLSGLNIGGRVTEVTLDSTSWTPLPATPLANRNSVSIQNQSSVEFKINYDNSVTGYVGVIVLAQSERYYEVTENVLLYGKCNAGTTTILIEELA